MRGALHLQIGNRQSTIASPMPHVTAIIPARFASTRLPGKPLLDETGKPLICHVIDQANRAGRIDSVIVATDDDRIRAAVQQHGGRAIMTRPDHPNGTSRIAEVAAELPEAFDIIVNVQGDEPEIPPDVIDRVVQTLIDSDTPMATIASPFAPGEDPADPNIVKVARNQRGCAMYFSRALIPFPRDPAPESRDPHLLKHLGLYAYRRDFLAEYVTLPPTPAEELEKLEQLRALEHGHAIAVAIAQTHHVGIDTPQQYAAFVERCKNA